MATIHLDAQSFKDRIFNYEMEQEWNFKGNKAAIIDFYAAGAVHVNQLHRYWKSYLTSTKTNW